MDWNHQMLSIMRNRDRFHSFTDSGPFDVCTNPVDADIFSIDNIIEHYCIIYKQKGRQYQAWERKGEFSGSDPDGKK